MNYPGRFDNLHGDEHFMENEFYDGEWYDENDYGEDE